MKQKVKAWVLFDGGTKFGEGRAELLRRIGAEGSLRRAVEQMEMSYRAAWGYVQELEAAAGFALIERAGKGPRSGTRLTERGRAFLAAFEVFHSRLDAAADREFRSAFAGFLQRGHAPGAKPRRAGARSVPPRPARGTPRRRA